MRKVLKKRKGYIIWGIIIALIFGGSVGVSVHMWKKTILLQNALDELKKKQVSTDAIREELKEVSKYSAYEFDYTSILYYSDPNKIMNLDVPFTNTTYIATIEGTMNIGIEGENVTFSTKKGEDGNITQITVQLPHSSILDNYTDSDTLQEYEYSKGAFNPIEPKEVTDLRSDAEKKEEKKVKKSDILEKSDERIEHLLKSNFRAFLGEDVEVVLEYIDEPNDNNKQSENNKS